MGLKLLVLLCQNVNLLPRAQIAKHKHECIIIKICTLSSAVTTLFIPLLSTGEQRKDLASPSHVHKGRAERSGAWAAAPSGGILPPPSRPQRSFPFPAGGEARS